MQSKTLVLGEKCVVLIQDEPDGEFKLYGCGTNCTLEVTTDFNETSAKGSGVNKTFRPSANSAVGTLEGLTDLGRTGLLSLPDLRRKQLAFTKMKMKFLRTAENGNFYLDEFDFYISGSSDSGAFGSMAQFNIAFKVTGAITITTNFGYGYGYGNGGIDPGELFLYDWFLKFVGIGDPVSDPVDVFARSCFATIIPATAGTTYATTLYLDESLLAVLNFALGYDLQIRLKNFSIVPAAPTEDEGIYYNVFEEDAPAGSDVWTEKTFDYFELSPTTDDWGIHKPFTAETEIPNTKVRTFVKARTQWAADTVFSDFTILRSLQESGLAGHTFADKNALNGVAPVPNTGSFSPFDPSLDYVYAFTLAGGDFTGKTVTVAETYPGGSPSDQTVNWIVTTGTGGAKIYTRSFVGGTTPPSLIELSIA